MELHNIKIDSATSDNTDTRELIKDLNKKLNQQIEENDILKDKLKMKLNKETSGVNGGDPESEDDEFNVNKSSQSIQKLKSSIEHIDEKDGSISKDQLLEQRTKLVTAVNNMEIDYRKLLFK
eukprot:CAMPEP_0116921170 /NCGR_PEP_ID=MMETSP0467-20121206/21467_1 /TAXON_ID=283647 /ORGANISM="Mesodinium pulex, Strain SPMC105" /LENGTH=121 /DNA_ID=CAMNT_0004599179 /DNA_START=932 /DNA_END=1297 /DNA_ORIENTATION=+